MLLAELIKEKDYIERSIYNLQDRIVDLSVGRDEEQKDISEYLAQLDELYKKHQKFSISIERAKHNAVIKVNDARPSLADAIAIKESMEHKLQMFRGMMLGFTRLQREGIGELRIDTDVLYDNMENIRLDIKTISGEIDYALWNVEVS